MSLKAKLPTWAFILVAAIGLAVSVLLYQYGISVLGEIRNLSIENAHWTKIIPKIDQLADWKTYRNEKYGFEVKYPNNWFNQVCNGDFISFDPSAAASKNICSCSGDEPCYPGIIFIAIHDEEQEFLSLDELTENFLKTEFKQESLTVGDDKMVKFFKEDRPGQIYVLIHKKDYSVEIVYQEFESPRYEKIFNQILSTFKFIEPTDTSDWKTYRNEEYGFEVKYPRDWEIFEMLDKQKYGREGITLNSPTRQEFEEINTPSDVNIIVETKSIQLSLEKFIEQYSDGWYSRYTVEEMTTIGGKSTRYVKSSVYRPANVIFIDNEHYILMISFNLDETYHPDMPNLATYKSIINTIRFTN